MNQETAASGNGAGIRIHCWKRGAVGGHVNLDASALSARRDELRAPDTMLWIDMAHPTAEEESLVFQSFFPVHPLTLEDITRLRREPAAPPHLPKVEEFRDYLFVIVNPLRRAFLDAIQSENGQPPPHERASTQLSAVLTENLLITHHEESVGSVDELRAFLSRHEEAHRGPDYLFHLILDGMVDQYALALDHFDEALETVEGSVLQQPEPATLQSLLKLKRQIVMLRKTLVYEREVVARLSRGEFSLIDEREMVYYRNVYDHLVRFTERIESSREMVTDLMQIHLAATSNKLNEVMKALTIISTVVLPMNLIAGIYGMNFEGQPEFKWRFGYPYALALMFATGISSFVFFRLKKWL